MGQQQILNDIARLESQLSKIESGERHVMNEDASMETIKNQLRTQIAVLRNRLSKGKDVY
jgi:small-conductance mechanosensitive channel